MLEITTTQFLIRLEGAFTDGIIDLSKLDLRQVDMRSAKVRELFSKVTAMATYSHASAPLFIDMSYSDISGRDFSNYNLTSVIMTGVRAEHTVFAGSNLTDVKLDEALLNYADFRKTNLSYTKFYNSSIHGTNFSFADMKTAYGLSLNAGSAKALTRLRVVSDITGSLFSDKIEKARDKIIAEIERCRLKEREARVKRNQVAQIKKDKKKSNW